MVSISDTVKQLVLQTPFLEDGLATGMINLSSLARLLRPRIEKHLQKNASDGAIIMALKRLADSLRKKRQGSKDLPKLFTDITVRSHLSEFTFLKSDTVLSKQIRLLQEVRNHPDAFVTFTSGVVEMTVIISSELDPKVEKLFAGEKLVSSYTRLSAIMLRLTTHTVTTPGVYYLILRLLAWENINIVEVVSTFTELIVLLDDAQIDHAFSILKPLLTLNT